MLTLNRNLFIYFILSYAIFNIAVKRSVAYYSRGPNCKFKIDDANLFAVAANDRLCCVSRYCRTYHVIVQLTLSVFTHSYIKSVVIKIITSEILSPQGENIKAKNTLSASL